MGYVTNGQISQPNSIPGLKPDVDLGGLKFSYQYGVFYAPVSEEIPVTLPPPFKAGP